LHLWVEFTDVVPFHSTKLQLFFYLTNCTVSKLHKLLIRCGFSVKVPTKLQCRTVLGCFPHSAEKVRLNTDKLSGVKIAQILNLPAYSQPIVSQNCKVTQSQSFPNLQ